MAEGAPPDADALLDPDLFQKTPISPQADGARPTADARTLFGKAADGRVSVADAAEDADHGDGDPKRGGEADPARPSRAAATSAPPFAGPTTLVDQARSQITDAARPAGPSAGPGAVANPALDAARAEVEAQPLPPGQPASPSSTLATGLSATLSGLNRATAETTAQITAQIAAQIHRRLEGRSTRFEMALTPQGLGRVDVSLDIDADGRLAATLAFDNPAAATELRGRADELRRQLEEAGFTLARDALDFADRDTSAGDGFDRRQNRAFAEAARQASQLASEAEAAVVQPAWTPLALTPRGVDMKV